jgi:hypothetical protein
MDVDQEIDELISDTEATDAVVSAKPVKQSRKIAKDDEEEGVCRWKDCDARYETANELGDHMNGCEWILGADFHGTDGQSILARRSRGYADGRTVFAMDRCRRPSSS